MQQGEFQLPPDIYSNLNSKSEQKRQNACKEIEIIVNKNADRKYLGQIDKLVGLFIEKYLGSFDIYKKIAGLQVMPSIINGLNHFPQGVTRFSLIIVNAILECLNDGEHKVRLTALKSLYYIAKTLDDRIIRMFNIIFEKLINKINDMDEVVKNAANFFDKSLQTILTSALNTQEGRQDFDLEGFMGIVKNKLKYKNPGVREYLIKWIINLNQIMSIDLLVYLPDLLQDLHFMVGDKQKNLQLSAQDCLKSFQKDLKDKFQQGKLEQYLTQQILHKMLSSLIKLAKDKSPNYTKLNALQWFTILFQFFRTQLQKPQKGKKFYFKRVIIQRFDQILDPILILMGHEDEGVQKAAHSANDKLMSAIQLLNKDENVNFAKVMPKLKEMLAQKKSTSTSQSALKWMKFMLENYNDKILPQIKQIIQKLVSKLCDSNVKNVNSIIEKTAVREQYFELLVQEMLLLLLRRNNEECHPQQILRKFSVIQEGDRFCRSICSQIIKSIDDKRFVAELVSYLNIIIINDKNMYVMRKKLQNMGGGEYHENFMVLFQAFKYNPATATSLCLLAQQYQLAYRILLTFSCQLQMSQKILVDFGKLAGLLQSPGFLPMRLQLLEKKDHFLIEALAALLMILPQGKVFNMLKGRLQVGRLVGASLSKVQQMKGQNQIDIQFCLKEYLQSQVNLRRAPS